MHSVEEGAALTGEDAVDEAALTGEDAMEEEALTVACEATGRRSPVPWARCVVM